MLTLFILILPLLFSFLVLPLSNDKLIKNIALAGSVLTLGLTFSAWFLFRNHAVSQLSVDCLWIEKLGIRFHLTLDGISLLMLLLTNILLPLIILSGYNKKQKRPNLFYALILFMQFALLGVFTAVNAFLFYIFWELALIPIYFIILLWGGENRQKITLKFFIYTLFGSLLMLFAFIYLYLQTSGNHSFEFSAFLNLPIDAKNQSWLFICMFAAFAIKMPLFPFHSWQPETYNAAPSQGTMLLSGIMLKMGIYSAIRWMLPVIPLGVHQWAHVAIILSIAGIIYGSWIALKQKNLKMLIAYSSLAHVGLMGAGIFSSNLQALQGVIFQMFSHGLIVISLFYIVDIIEQKTKTNLVDELSGIKNRAPKFSAVFLLIMLGSIGLPLTNGFVGEFLMLTGIYQFKAVFALFAGLTIILGAIYMLYVFQKIMLGNTNSKTVGFTDIGTKELLIFIPVIILIFLLGIHPQPLLNLTESAAQGILNYVVNR